MIKRIFVDHPASVGETYFEHMGTSATFGSKMLLGSLACFVHALVPSLCVRTGSSVVNELHTRMVTRMPRKGCRSSGDTPHV